LRTKVGGGIVGTFGIRSFGEEGDISIIVSNDYGSQGHGTNESFKNTTISSTSSKGDCMRPRTRGDDAFHSQKLLSLWNLDLIGVYTGNRE